MEDALKIQIGGSHYNSLKMQPIELITKIECTFIQGNIIKYITRYKNKNGKQDIEKCIHYAELANQLKSNGNIGFRKFGIVQTYCSINGLSNEQRTIINHCCYDNYNHVIKACKALIANEYPEQINVK